MTNAQNILQRANFVVNLGKWVESFVTSTVQAVTTFLVHTWEDSQYLYSPDI